MVVLLISCILHCLSILDLNGLLVKSETATLPPATDFVAKSRSSDLGSDFHADEVRQAGYSTSRMTWIKTNFLWMMYRSGWASKPSQERILAITITRRGFDEILLNAATKGDGPVRLQWDPDHNPDGSKVPDRRAIQLGLRREMLEKFSREFIVKVDDVTEFVKEQAKNVSDTCDNLMVPEEHVYLCSEEVANNIHLDVV